MWVCVLLKHGADDIPGAEGRRGAGWIGALHPPTVPARSGSGNTVCSQRCLRGRSRKRGEEMVAGIEQIFRVDGLVGDTLDFFRLGKKMATKFHSCSTEARISVVH